jgi:hypothetical protein
MRLGTLIIAALLAALYCLTGCATSPPTYVKAEVTPTAPWGGGNGTAVTITDQQALAQLVSALPPGVAMGRRSSLAVGGIVSHRIRLTHASGRADTITIYNGGSAWSEGRGDWPLDDAAGDELGRWIASAQSGQFE